MSKEHNLFLGMPWNEATNPALTTAAAAKPITKDDVVKAFEEWKAKMGVDRGNGPDVGLFPVYLFAPNDVVSKFLQPVPFTIEPLEWPEGGDLKFKFRPFVDYSIKMMGVPRALLYNYADDSPRYTPRKTGDLLIPTPISFWQAVLCVVVGGWIICTLAGLL